jgi:DNA-binding transcriptional MerR regulator
MTGVSADTLRHYERKGVLAVARRLPNGYRSYPPEAIERAKMQTLKQAIAYRYEESEKGARVLISSTDAEAVDGAKLPALSNQGI